MSTHSGYTIERMNLYRDGAVLAAEMASPCEDTEMREVYLSIARTWSQLADKIQKELRDKRGTA